MVGLLTRVCTHISNSYPQSFQNHFHNNLYSPFILSIVCSLQYLFKALLKGNQIISICNPLILVNFDIIINGFNNSCKLMMYQYTTTLNETKKTHIKYRYRMMFLTTQKLICFVCAWVSNLYFFSFLNLCFPCGNLGVTTLNIYLNDPSSESTIKYIQKYHSLFLLRTLGSL